VWCQNVSRKVAGTVNACTNANHIPNLTIKAWWSNIPRLLPSILLHTVSVQYVGTRLSMVVRTDLYYIFLVGKKINKCLNTHGRHTNCLQTRFWLHGHDHRCALTLLYNNCAETHLDGGLVSTLIFPLAASHLDCLWRTWHHTCVIILG